MTVGRMVTSPRLPLPTWKQRTATSHHSHQSLGYPLALTTHASNSLCNHATKAGEWCLRSKLNHNRPVRNYTHLPQRSLPGPGCLAMEHAAQIPVLTVLRSTNSIRGVYNPSQNNPAPHDQVWSSPEQPAPPSGWGGPRLPLASPCSPGPYQCRCLPHTQQPPKQATPSDLVTLDKKHVPFPPAFHRPFPPAFWSSSASQEILGFSGHCSNSLSTAHEH